MSSEALAKEDWALPRELRMAYATLILRRRGEFDAFVERAVAVPARIVRTPRDAVLRDFITGNVWFSRGRLCVFDLFQHGTN
jgi:hypothetical protein